MDVIVVVPTYNEAKNLPGLLDRLSQYPDDLSVLVVDDGSPDGTGVIADERSSSDASIHVLHRTTKDGLGAAYRAGFAEALEGDYDIIVQMDCDGSHRVEDLPGLIDVACRGIIAIGSRKIAGGSNGDWSFGRAKLSEFGNVYAKWMCRLPINDATSGFRAWPSRSLGAIDLTRIRSNGYAFQIEMAYRAVQLGLAIEEVPIEFRDRTEGESKMDSKIIIEALKRTTQWGFEERRRKSCK